MIGGLFFWSDIEFINSLLLAFTHPKVAQSKLNIFPVPAGDSRAAIDLLFKASITNFTIIIYHLPYISFGRRKVEKGRMYLYHLL